MDTNRIYKRVFLQLALFGFGINNSIIIVFSQKLYVYILGPYAYLLKKSLLG